jgi:hypothetical protein
MREVILLDCEECRCSPPLLLAFREFSEGFADWGVSVKEVTKITDIHNNAIVFMGNGMKDGFVDLLHSLAPEAIYIGWFWEIDVSRLKYFIYTFENCLTPGNMKTRFDYLQFATQGKNHCPFLFRANDPPEKIGTYERQVQRHYCYMGWGYCREYIPEGNGICGLYHGVFDHSQFIGYSERRQFYLSSVFALGFQSPENIANGHVSQRVYEGLAYGCIVLTNSMPAVEQTEGIAVYVADRQDVEAKIAHYMAHPEEVEIKKKQGYDFIRRCGTNRHAILRYVEVIRNLFEIDILV